MNRFELAAEDIQALRTAHRSSKIKKDAYKINAIILLDGCLSFFKNQADHFDEIESIMGDGLAALI